MHLSVLPESKNPSFKQTADSRGPSTARKPRRANFLSAQDDRKLNEEGRFTPRPPASQNAADESSPASGPAFAPGACESAPVIRPGRTFPWRGKHPHAYRGCRVLTLLERSMAGVSGDKPLISSISRPPSMPGIIRSVRTRSTPPCLNHSSACAPLEHETTR